MKTLRVIATGAAIAFATVGYAQDAEFSEVDVSIQLADASASNALSFWPEIEQDMEAVIKQRVSTVYNPNGLYVTVSVGEISLDGTKTLADSGNFNTIRGVAIIREEQSGPVSQVVEFGLRAQPWEVSIVDGMFVLADKEEFYVAMLNRFADEMVDGINAQ